MTAAVEGLRVLDDAARACIHCGLCLPECPTYVLAGNEMDSPRGRIYLIRGLADGRIEATASVRGHLDLCLGCRACEAACPSNVKYGEILEQARDHLAVSRAALHRWDERLLDWLLYEVLPHADKLRGALRAARGVEWTGLPRVLRTSRLLRRVSPGLSKALNLLPPEVLVSPTGPGIPGSAAPAGPPRASVDLFAGCAASVLTPRTNACAQRVLIRNGCEVRCPQAQVCCGAIHHHGGRALAARELARANIDAFAGDQPIITTAGGCSAMMKRYPDLLAGDRSYADRAARFARRVRDVSEFLVTLGPVRPTRHTPIKVAYHDACHLAHVQGIRRPPRELLSLIPGLSLVPLDEPEMCCGAAGSYNVLEPEMAGALGRRKVRNLTASGADVAAMGNVGCILHLRATARESGTLLPIVHTIELLHDAYEWPSEPACPHAGRPD